MNEMNEVRAPSSCLAPTQEAKTFGDLTKAAPEFFKLLVKQGFSEEDGFVAFYQ